MFSWILSFRKSYREILLEASNIVNVYEKFEYKKSLLNRVQKKEFININFKIIQIIWFEKS